MLLVLLFSVHRCASCPGQLLAIPKVARETLQWKILGKPACARAPRFRLKPGTRFQRVKEKPPPPAHTHTSCIFKYIACGLCPLLKDGGFTKFSPGGFMLNHFKLFKAAVLLLCLRRYGFYCFNMSPFSRSLSDKSVCP